MNGNLQYENVLMDFLGWLKIHTLGHEHLLHATGVIYNWGYINACKTIASELRRLLEEYTDDGEGIERNKGLLE